jgi:dihydrodipicolinate synthase/N-acetylneuraminate lyase
MNAPLTGIVPPLATPLCDQDTLDVAGMERLIEHVVGGGVHGLFILGTTGEGASLSYRLRRELIERACHQVNRRVPVLVGVTDTSFVESVNLARHAAEAGADAAVVAPPYSMPEGQAELVEYFVRLGKELPLPFYLYNMPPLTKVNIELETVRRSMDVPRILGFKDSSGKMDYFRAVAALLQHRPDWTLLMGPEHLLFDSVTAGGHGGVSGGANLFPKLYVRLFEEAHQGNTARARELQEQVTRVGDSLYRISRHPSSVIKGIKRALACLGVCDDYVAEPFQRLSTDERALIERRVKELEADLAKLDL